MANKKQSALQVLFNQRKTLLKALRQNRKAIRILLDPPVKCCYYANGSTRCRRGDQNCPQSNAGSKLVGQKNVGNCNACH